MNWSNQRNTIFEKLKIQIETVFQWDRQKFRDNNNSNTWFFEACFLQLIQKFEKQKFETLLIQSKQQAIDTQQPA